MAYVRKAKARRLFNVTFEEGHAFAGLYMKTNSLTIDELTQFGIKMAMVQADARLAQGGSKDLTVEELEAAYGTFREHIQEVRVLFEAALIEWDMQEEDGSPTPADLEGISRLDDFEFLDLLNGWLTAMAAADAPGVAGGDLGKGSESGGTFPELSGLMEPLSQSQVS